MGDWHVGRSIKNEFGSMIPQFKKFGFTHVGFELLSADMQPLLDQHHMLWRDPESNQSALALIRQELVLFFSQVWGNDSDKGEAAALASVASTLTAMVDATAANRVRTLALEPPVPRMFAEGHGWDFIHSGLEKLPQTKQRAFNKFWSDEVRDDQLKLLCEELRSALVAGSGWSDEQALRFVDILLRMRSAEPRISLSSLSLPRPSQTLAWQMDRDWQDLMTSWRERTWLTVVEGALKNPNATLLLFAGCGHFGYEMPQFPPSAKAARTFNERLADNEHKSRVIGFAGGDCPIKLMSEVLDEYGQPLPPAVKITQAAIEAGVSDQRFAFPVRSEGSRGSDWVVHLPRTQELRP
jgi:hypothetical protein